MTDVLLRHTPDGGEIDFINGQPVLADGVATAVYLSLFGGNEQDSGLEGDEAKQWWGNFTEIEPSRRYRSETQFLLRTLNATPANAARIEEAAVRDLAWMTEAGIALAVSVFTSMPARNTISIAVEVGLQSGVIPINFSDQPWGPSTP